VTNSLQVSRFGGDDHTGLLDHVVLSSSACLAKCPVATIDTIVVSTLKELCRAEGADHAGWYLLREGPHILERLDSISTAEIFDKASSFDSCALPWCRSCLLKGHPVILNDLTELPDHAEIDGVYLRSFGVQSLALIPIKAGEAELGVLGILALSQPGRWSSTLAKQGALLGSAFLSARSRKVIYRETQPSNSDFQEVFRSASVGMALEDTSGGLLYVNEALCTMLGYPEIEMIQRRCVDFSHPGDLEREAVLFGQLFEGTRQSYDIEKRFLSRSGSTVWGKVNVTLLREHAGRPPLVLGVVEDITSQKSALEKLNRSQMEVQALASRILLSQEDERRSIARELHDDIGQRLSMVTSEIHLLNSDPGTPGQTRLAPLDRLTEELDTLVTDLHNLSHRLHSSKLQHLGVKFALDELCGRMSRVGLHVDLNLSEALEPVPEGAAICLMRIAQEALNNVLKHSGANQAVVNLSKAIDGYYLTIVDPGRGFDTEAFSTGIGLISMRERVRSSQGRLTIHSRPNEGTEIAVWIPPDAPVN
jgi:PAS domain S-box-containing protein